MIAGYLNYVELCRVQVPVAAVGGQELGSVGIPWELGSVGLCLHAAEHRHRLWVQGMRAGSLGFPRVLPAFGRGGTGRCGSGWVMELAPGQDCPAELGKSEALL